MGRRVAIDPHRPDAYITTLGRSSAKYIEKHNARNKPAKALTFLVDHAKSRSSVDARSETPRKIEKKSLYSHMVHWTPLPT